MLPRGKSAVQWAAIVVPSWRSVGVQGQLYSTSAGSTSQRNMLDPPPETTQEPPLVKTVLRTACTWPASSCHVPVPPSTKNRDASAPPAAIKPLPDVAARLQMVCDSCMLCTVWDVR
jgi:hypothetical protein